MLQDSQDQKEDEDEDEDIRRNEVTPRHFIRLKVLSLKSLFFLGMEEETLPHKKSIQENGISEELRLAYVGITRAREELIMTYCKERKIYGKNIARHKSRFLSTYPRGVLLSKIEPHSDTSLLSRQKIIKKTSFQT